MHNNIKRRSIGVAWREYAENAENAAQSILGFIPCTASNKTNRPAQNAVKSKKED